MRSPTAVPATVPCPDVHDLDALAGRLRRVRAGLLEWEQRLDALLGLAPERRESARNLIHYMALRREELRPVQESLAACGLSSLGRAESHVLANLDAVIAFLDAGAGRHAREPEPVPLTRADGSGILDERADALFGVCPADRAARIMVTMPDSAATDPSLVHDLLAAGMDCMRINCAHGDERSWTAMIENLRRAEAAVGRSCRVQMDIAGPHARTGALQPGPAVVKLKPQRDALGGVTRAARVWLTAAESPAPPPHAADAVLPVTAELLIALQRGDALRFRDARAARRTLVVGDREEGGCWASIEDTAYVTSDTPIEHVPGGAGRAPIGGGRVGTLPPIAQALTLDVGDRLVLTRAATPGQPAVYDASGALATCARIPCHPAEALDGVQPGEPIWFDDGRIGGRIESVGADEVVVAITAVPVVGARLKAQKGINLPESDLRLPSLTAQDIASLPFIAAHADLVGHSFVRTSADVDALFDHLHTLGADATGVVLKIETARAVAELPGILLAALGRPAVGIMIARGDLAVECGFAHLAEIQDDILCMCEAAHLPVIWATQVLDTLAKQGRPSRAEVTDAAVGARAECVMLNKGPHAVEAVRALSSILERMQAHQQKKQFLLGRLPVADIFLQTASGAADAAGPAGTPAPPVA